MKYIIFALLVLIASNLDAQSKRDYNWVMGYPAGSSDIHSRFILSFDYNKRSVSRFSNGHRRIAFNNASISSEEGELLFYTNGCTVYDSTYQVMMNGDSLNNNQWFDLFCDEHASGLQNTMILPDPGNEDGYYILHQPLFFFEDPLTFQSVRLLYTYVDMTLNEGRGAITVKNQAYHEENIFGSGFFSACRHQNGDDWWFIKTRLNSNIKYIYGIDHNGIFLEDSIAIGDTITRFISAGGQAKFSSDGNKYVTHSPVSGLNIYDFDRETGQLSNHEAIFLQETEVALSGLELSPSGQFCYVTFPFILYQVDLWAEDIAASTVIIDTLDMSVMDPFLLLFTMAQLGPDCKIYITSGNTVRALHVINNPDEKGTDCNFVQSGLKLDVPHDRNSLPHFPHFRIDEDDICDPTITNVFGLPIVSEEPIVLSPNPATYHLDVDVGSGEDAAYSILDYQGRTVLQGRLTGDRDRLDISAMPDGIYFLRISIGDSARVEKFVKM